MGWKGSAVTRNVRYFYKEGLPWTTSLYKTITSCVVLYSTALRTLLNTLEILLWPPHCIHNENTLLCNFYVFTKNEK